MSTEPELYGEDKAHPIPFLDRLDIEGVKKGGGSDLIIVIASPLRGDVRSQKRLLKKIENYFGYARSRESQSRSGAPCPHSTSVVVRIHKLSDPLIFSLLARCHDWALENQVSLVVQPEDYGPVG